MIDRKTKLLLALIAIALWGIVLRPLIPAREARAQSQTKTTQAPAPAQAPLKSHYEFLDSDKGGTDGIYQLKDKVDQMALKGWTAKSVSITSDATVILMEKTE
jgi:hypothetical protein